MNFAALLMALGGPIARQVMVALGFSLVTFAGADVAVSSLLGQARNAWSSGLGGDVAAYLAMGGFNHGLSLVAGAIVGRVALMSLKSWRVL